MSRKLEIVNLLLEATRSRALRWERIDSRTYGAAEKGHQFRITFKYPLLAMDDGSDADIAEVHVPGLTLTFYNGTEGFDLVLQTLAEDIPERTAGYARFVSRAEEAVRLLRDLGEAQDENRSPGQGPD